VRPWTTSRSTRIARIRAVSAARRRPVISQ
jgi:hypothetical protein